MKKGKSRTFSNFLKVVKHKIMSMNVEEYGMPLQVYYTLS